MSVYHTDEGTQPVPDKALVDLIFADGSTAKGVEAGWYSWSSIQADRITFWRLHEQEQT